MCYSCYLHVGFVVLSHLSKHMLLNALLKIPVSAFHWSHLISCAPLGNNWNHQCFVGVCLEYDTRTFFYGLFGSKVDGQKFINVTYGVAGDTGTNSMDVKKKLIIKNICECGSYSDWSVLPQQSATIIEKQSSTNNRGKKHDLPNTNMEKRNSKKIGLTSAFHTSYYGTAPMITSIVLSGDIIEHTKWNIWYTISNNYLPWVTIEARIKTENRFSNQTLDLFPVGCQRIQLTLLSWFIVGENVGCWVSYFGWVYLFWRPKPAVIT